MNHDKITTNYKKGNNKAKNYFMLTNYKVANKMHIQSVYDYSRTRITYIQCDSSHDGEDDDDEDDGDGVDVNGDDDDDGDIDDDY